MTDVAILDTPRDWPAILLPRPAVGRTAGSRSVDPADLDAAVAAGAFAGLKRAIRDLGATGTLAAVGASGLRGRGGAGYPAADKWRAAIETEARSRIVVANGYGADPATRTDQVLLEHNPYAVIEGLAIAADRKSVV